MFTIHMLNETRTLGYIIKCVNVNQSLRDIRSGQRRLQ